MSYALCRASNEYRMWEPIVFGFLVFFRPDERTATGVNTDSAYRGRQLTWPPSKRRPWVISPGNQIHLYPLSSIACGLGIRIREPDQVNHARGAQKTRSVLSGEWPEVQRTRPGA